MPVQRESPSPACNRTQCSRPARTTDDVAGSSSGLSLPLYPWRRPRVRPTRLITSHLEAFAAVGLLFSGFVHQAKLPQFPSPCLRQYRRFAAAGKQALLARAPLLSGIPCPTPPRSDPSAVLSLRCMRAAKRGASPRPSLAEHPIS